jgi:hypothetical protein
MPSRTKRELSVAKREKGPGVSFIKTYFRDPRQAKLGFAESGMGRGMVPLRGWSSSRPLTRRFATGPSLSRKRRGAKREL